MPRIAMLIPTGPNSGAIEDAMEAAAEAGMGMLAFVVELHERVAHDEEKCLSFRLALIATALVELGISPKALGDPVVITRLQKEMLDFARSRNSDHEVDLGALLTDFGKEIYH